MNLSAVASTHTRGRSSTISNRGVSAVRHETLSCKVYPVESWNLNLCKFLTFSIFVARGCHAIYFLALTKDAIYTPVRVFLHNISFFFSQYQYLVFPAPSIQSFLRRFTFNERKAHKTRMNSEISERSFTPRLCGIFF